MRCETKNCKSKAVYNMYRINKDMSKDWLNVCAKCEGKIGTMNMKRLGYSGISGKLVGGKK